MKGIGNGSGDVSYMIARTGATRYRVKRGERADPRKKGEKITSSHLPGAA